MVYLWWEYKDGIFNNSIPIMNIKLSRDRKGNSFTGKAYKDNMQIVL